ncbi:unnamed protein product [Peniophora sp. CBMAI 1063]|nr:unnamed protein product [Peniophora sp. CBMAI 1063]
MASTNRRLSIPAVAADKQPKTIKLTVMALLSLPWRLCNPPPAVGKVRSCQVTPVFKVTLDDVLDRKHLPPLGLKDFEEWLLFVEGNAENLYFMLWFKEYSAQYSRWYSQAKPPKPSESYQSDDHYRFSTQAAPSAPLAHFYNRCKQTFFTPGAEFELDIPSDILSPFHTGHFVSPHPDPIVFNDVVRETRRMLKDSLDRFVLASYTNVGSQRALCGTVGGTVFAIAGFVAPMVMNFMHHRSRWLRLLALPGLWIGLTIILASLHGVCMMVYIFGDLRQLRKFELERPAISAPRPLGFHESSVENPAGPATYKPATLSSQSMLPAEAFVRPRAAPTPPPLTALTIPPLAMVHEERSPSAASDATPYERNSYGSASQRSSCSSVSSLATDDADDQILGISGPYYDVVPAPEGPATRVGPWTEPAESPYHADHTPECVLARTHGVATAGFIRAFEPERDAEAGIMSTSAFDFDALPVRECVKQCICGADAENAGPAVASSIALPLEKEKTLVRQISGIVSAPLAAMTPKYRAKQASLPPAPTERSRPYCQHGKPDVIYVGREARCGKADCHPVEKKPKSGMRARTALAIQRAVPAFGPLTRVLNPVISRAQWEIVVRSAIIAAIISFSVVFGLVAVPVMPPH